MAYADYTYYSETYKGSELSEQNADTYLGKASKTIDRITFYRISDSEMSQLTEFQREIIQNAACEIADFIVCNEDLLSSPFGSYAINGVSVGSSRAASLSVINGSYVPSDVYENLLATGLCIPVCR